MIKEIMLFMLCLSTLTSSCAKAYPTTSEDYKLIERDYASPGAHQLASWLASQLRPKELVPSVEIPVVPYRLPVHNGKRNSEVTNAMMTAEETQKLYREGRK
ncbi:uncharacterized protein [Euwallacea fornicatus]|uniref:uncharacterized protein n=1 Tax=Euwallacea fornicatus TaxID=995702 RepID=UPI00338EF9F5